MNTTDLLQTIGTILTAIGLVVAWRKLSHESDKLEGETAVLYANLSTSSAKRITELSADIETLREDIRKKNETIVSMQTELRDLRIVLDEKNARIHELEVLSKHQEQEIAKLRAELNRLKKLQT